MLFVASLEVIINVMTKWFLTMTPTQLIRYELNVWFCRFVIQVGQKFLTPSDIEGFID